MIHKITFYCEICKKDVTVQVHGEPGLFENAEKKSQAIRDAMNLHYGNFYRQHSKKEPEFDPESPYESQYDWGISSE